MENPIEKEKAGHVLNLIDQLNEQGRILTENVEELSILMEQVNKGKIRLSPDTYKEIEQSVVSVRQRIKTFNNQYIKSIYFKI
ncbi:MAG: hypothetical protein AB2L20_30065 [Mangrovibacterium sp.]